MGYYIGRKIGENEAVVIEEVVEPAKNTAAAGSGAVGGGTIGGRDSTTLSLSHETETGPERARTDTPSKRR